MLLWMKLPIIFGIEKLIVIWCRFLMIFYRRRKMQRGSNILMNFIGLHLRTDSASVYDILGRVRWTRRPRHPPPWHVKQKTPYIQQNLTKQNEAFLKEITQDIYEEKAKSVASLIGNASPLRLDGATVERQQWTPESIRTGLVAKKIGVVPQWTKDGKMIVCTLLQVQDNYVARYTDPETWYKTSKVGKRSGRRVLGRSTVAVNPSDPEQFTAQYRGMFEQSGVMPPAKLATFAITPDAKLEPGTRLYATHFKVGQYLTLWGRTIDRGFQGVMARWGFKGGKGLNVTKNHRRTGSIGSRAERKVWRGKHMPGHMGWEWRPAYGAKLIRINTKYQVLYVVGNMVMGKTGNYIYVRDCGIWTKRVKDPPFPTDYPYDNNDQLPEDIYDPSLFNFSDPTITFPEVDEKKLKTRTGSKGVKKQAKVKK